MKILITNFRLAERTASEIYARDIAKALVAGGNTVAIFASKKGKLAVELEEEGIPVLEHPLDVPFQPDIIHGQFNLETITALLSFPEVPAVYMSHGSQQWRGQPPRHPRILRYVAHSTHVGEWLLNSLGLSKRAFLLVPNFVEMSRFEEIRRLPEEPQRALIYDRATAPGRHLDAIHHACRCCGIELDMITNLVGKTSTRPEILLPQYDLVFASGRPAIEALASGCGVITLNGGHCGQLVHSENFEAIRDANFSTDDQRQGKPQTVEEIVSEIHKWDWRRLAPVARRVREELDCKIARTRLERLYRKVIKDYEENPVDPREEFPALAEWLIKMADQHHAVDSGFLAIQNRVSSLASVGRRTEQQKDELVQQLEAEKEKVRAARRLLNDGNLVHRGLRKRIEGEWKEIAKKGDDDSFLPGANGNGHSSAQVPKPKPKSSSFGGHLLTEENGFVFAEGVATNGFEKGLPPAKFPDASASKIRFGVELPR